MPELPEVTLYVEALQRHVVGRTLERVRLRSPSLLKTYDPPLSAVEGRRVLGLGRIGKRIIWQMEGELWLVFHLMITGRFRWRKPGAAVPRKRGHAAFDFPHGTLLLTEASAKKRASLHVVRGAESLETFDRGGVEPLESSLEEFRTALLRENRTLKRVLTDPRLVSGIGNAHSDEILLAARLSPLKRTRGLTEDEIAGLHRATRDWLEAFTERLRTETGDGFPERITAFHPAMRVHGRYGKPCPVCGTPIQRIRYGENETDYCPGCQTEGRLLRDRSLSRILRDDWPRTLDELENIE